MIFTRIAIENLGVFRGRAEFELTPKSGKSGSRPIILFGGMNGSGKTTVFEAFKLALYGSGAFWPPQSREKYDLEMRNRLSHHPALLSTQERASVELGVRHTHLGRTHDYRVKRSWAFQGKSVKESLEVLRDGMVLDEIERTLWQEFVWDLIPPGLSRLYFFDGERIQSLADDGSSALQLADSFRALMGLDLVERLSSDLETIVARELRTVGGNKISNELSSVQKQLQDLQERRATLVSSRASVQSEIDAIRLRIEMIEKRVAAEGGGWAKERETLLSNHAKASTELELCERRMKELAAGVLPFTLVPELSSKVLVRIRRELEYDRWAAASKLIRGRIATGLAKLESESEQTSNSSVMHMVIQLVSKMVEEALTQPGSIEDVQPLNSMSERDTERVQRLFAQSVPETAKEITEWSKRHEMAVREFRSISAMLAKAPSDHQLAPLVAQMNRVHRKLVVQLEKAAKLDSALATTDREITSARRGLEKIKEGLFKQERQDSILDMARRVELVLREFQDRLTQSRVASLSGRLAETFSSLSRKKGWLGGVRIDPKTFEVTLLDREGRQLPKERLAAGEKQIYAVALLWALAQASGRSLPFIIDTPLGRLDSDHRRSLIGSFFPFASEQVIIFSTDTEIDRPYFDALVPYISRSYRLSNDARLGTSRVEEGYFWKKEAEGLAQ